MPCADCAPSEGPVQRVNGHTNGIESTHVAIETGSSNGIANGNGAVAPAQVTRGRVSTQPMQATAIGNLANFKIIESTLREGEQFANAFFDTETKIRIAKALDEMGVDCIELTSPAASEQSRSDCEAICKLGLKTKVITHIRCHMDDARIACETGVDGVDVVTERTLPTSPTRPSK
jgi:homocitrate synthase